MASTTNAAGHGSVSRPGRRRMAVMAAGRFMAGRPVYRGIIRGSRLTGGIAVKVGGINGERIVAIAGLSRVLSPLLLLPPHRSKVQRHPAGHIRTVVTTARRSFVAVVTFLD